MGGMALEKDIDRVLFTQAEIRAGVDRIGGEVGAYFRDDACTVVSVLKGGCIFTADLIRCLSFPLSLTFTAVSSYRDGTAAGTLSLEYFPAEKEIQGRRILLVDDILDTGRTLEFLRAALFEHGASEVKTCVLLDKPARRVVDCEADFRCFAIEDVFVVGYGLDFAGRYRNLPYIATLRSEVFGQSIHTE